MASTTPTVISLSEDDTEKLNEWFRAIFQSSGSTFQAENEMKTWCVQRFPIIVRQRLSNGVAIEVPGLDISEDVKTFGRKGANGQFTFPLLHLAAEKHDHALIEWALLGGWNPNFFNGRNTPLGQAIYTGDCDAVRLMHDFGADVCMTLTEEQSTGPYPFPSNMIGSTALHRVMERPTPNKPAMVQLLAELYIDPLPKDALGRTPLDLAYDRQGIQSLLAEASKRERRALTTWADETLQSPSTTPAARPRL